MTSATINTVVISGAVPTVSITVSGANPGPISIMPLSVAAGGSPTLNDETLATTAPGIYVITITGTGASAAHSTTYTLTVQSASSVSRQCTPDPNRQFIPARAN